MRLVKALSDEKGNQYDGPRSAINRSGNHTIQVTINVVKPRVFAVFEANIAHPTKISFNGPLLKSVRADEVENFLARQGYDLDPDEWYPG